MSATRKAIEDMKQESHNLNRSWLEESINCKTLRRVDELDRQLAEAIRMIGKAHERIEQLESLIARVEQLELLPGQLKTRFAKVDERVAEVVARIG